MKFMMMIKADDRYEAGAPPPPELMSKMGALTEKWSKKGGMVLAGGLLPSRQGKRIVASRGDLTVLDGPFAETKELLAGFAIMEFPSLEDAVAAGKEFMQLHVDVLGPEWHGTTEIRPMV